MGRGDPPGGFDSRPPPLAGHAAASAVAARFEAPAIGYVFVPAILGPILARAADPLGDLLARRANPTPASAQ